MFVCLLCEDRVLFTQMFYPQVLSELEEEDINDEKEKLRADATEEIMALDIIRPGIIFYSSLYCSQKIVLHNKAHTSQFLTDYSLDTNVS